ncbi:MAG: hypothetical protein HYV04_18100 [Deltaproteobacteria bacterium]|nr:hypothetical protein [Deltaproteobacteria bacterium]
MGILSWKAKAAGIWLLIMGGILFPALVRGQEGFYATPSFSLTEIYDDNIFSAVSGRKGDFITRLSPGILAGYESAPLTILGEYTFDGELFAHRTDLNKAFARQKAALDFRYLPVRLLTLALKGEFIETVTPTQLNLIAGLPPGASPPPGTPPPRTGVALARERARHFLVDPSVAYRFTPFITGNVGYTFIEETVRGTTTDGHIGKLGAEYRHTRLDTGSLEYFVRTFLFNKKNESRFHTILPGWTHDFTPQTSATLKAGPRFSERGGADVDVAAEVRHRMFRQGDAVLSYTRTTTAAIASSGASTTDNVGLLFRYRPWEHVELTFSPNYYHTKLVSNTANVYSVKFDASYDITRWLSAIASYEHRFEKGILPGFGTPARPSAEVVNNIFVLGLTTKFRTRVY